LPTFFLLVVEEVREGLLAVALAVVALQST
jgi:hypothetical protein